MKTNLDQKQIKHLSRLIEMKGVNYYDVNMELTDHIACEVESLINETELEYMKAVKKVFLRYDRFHFMRIEEQKSKELAKKGRQAVWKGFVNYFSIPKVILTISIFILIVFLLKTLGAAMIMYTIIALMLVICVKFLINKKRNVGQYQYLQLRMYGGGFTMLLFQLPLQVFINSSSSDILIPTTEGIYIKAIVFTMFILLNLINYELYTDQLNKLKTTYA